MASQEKVNQDPRQAKSRAPMAPSIVLPGLIAGAILWRPIRRPTVYAPMSPIFTTMIHETSAPTPQPSLSVTASRSSMPT